MKRATTVLFILFIFIGIVAFSEEDDFIIAQPGDSGADAEIVLQKAAELGFLKDLPKGEDEYRDEYAESIIKMEQALGFTEDGIIRLSEFEELETAIAPGSKGDEVKEILEDLFELGYIREILPEPHNLYEQKYINAVKNAEKKLGCRIDGILTKSELEQIQNQQDSVLGEIKNVNAYHSNGKVKISWNAVQGAVYYEVYRSGTLVARIKGKTSWEDAKVHMNNTYVYYVRPGSYKKAGKTSKSVRVEVPITYKAVNLKDLFNSGNKYMQQDTQYVKFSSMKFVSGTVSGSDYKIEISQKVNGRTYKATLILEDYKNWTGDVPNLNSIKYKIKTISGQGYVQSGGSVPVIVLNHISYSW